MKCAKIKAYFGFVNLCFPKQYFTVGIPLKKYGLAHVTEYA